MAGNRRAVRKKPWTVTRTKSTIADVLICLFILVVSLTCVLPFIHVLSKSISTESFVIANKVILLPKGITFDAYKKIFSDHSILRSMYVSIVVTVLFTIIGMIVTICAAYPLSRKHLKWMS